MFAVLQQLTWCKDFDEIALGSTNFNQNPTNYCSVRRTILITTVRDLVHGELTSKHQLYLIEKSI